MPTKKNNKGTGKSKSVMPGNRNKPPSTFQRKVAEPFHLGLKHVLGGVSLLSLLAAFEVFSIPAASGVIDLFQFTQFSAGLIWMFVALVSGGIAVLLDWEEKDI